MLRNNFPLFILSFLFLFACAPSTIFIHPVNEQGRRVNAAKIILEGREVGKGKTNITLNPKSQKIIVDASPKYFPEAIMVSDRDSSKKEIKVKLITDKAFHDTLSYNESKILSNNFIQMKIAPQRQDASEWWSIIVGTVTGNYEPDLMDGRSGYLRTQWKNRNYAIEGKEGDYIIRRRFVGNVQSNNPLRYQMKLEVERKLPWEKKYKPWNRLYPEDISLLKNIKSKIDADDPANKMYRPSNGYENTNDLNSQNQPYQYYNSGSIRNRLANPEEILDIDNVNLHSLGNLETLPTLPGMTSLNNSY